MTTLREALLAQLRARRAAQPAAAGAASPQPAAFELVFPPDHAMAQLRTLWAGGGDDSPVYLKLHPSVKIPNHASAEAASLRVALNLLAQRRLRQACADSPSPVCDLDEYPFIHLTRDGMAAWLLLLPPIGQGKQLSAADLRQALQRRGVVYGLDEAFLDQIPAIPQRFFQFFPVALGSPPVHGTDGKIIDRYPRELIPSTEIDELDQADYTSLHLVQDINEGDVICEIVPPTPKVDGMSVVGAPIRARQGAQAVVPQGRNTALSQDGTQLIATHPGHVEFSGRTFQVKPILEIFDNVDQSTGDINFLGDVHIHGDICQGVTIRAMGNIQVDGVIEACTIEAGENLIVSSGIQGQDCAVIRAHKSVYAKYLEHCSVYTRQSVMADYMIGCNIFSNGAVKARTGRGVIVGGTVRSAQEISANTVGSKAECNTAIVLKGLPYNEFERSQLKDVVTGLEQELSKMEGQASAQAALPSLRLNLCVAKMKLEKFDKECAAMADSARLSNDSRCLICDTVYPGTELTIDNQTICMIRTDHNCLFRLVNGCIKRG